ncbi:MAG TPA: hypothetical protein VJ583_05640 [Nitrososphaeraceae archaeon]|nr:hypothetical protein [Nitrososphaeraceae archaeon]
MSLTLSKQIIENNTKQIRNLNGEIERIADQQKQQLENTTTSTISNIANEYNDTFNEYQKINHEIIDKSLDTTNRYQQRAINTMQTIANNYVELQNNILNTYQSAFSKFINDTSNNKSYWNNFVIPAQTFNIYNKINQNIIDNTINSTGTMHEFIIEYIETFNKSIEIAQKYYKNGIKNYFNLLRK